MTKRVLIVDDCDVTLKVLSRVMSDLGFEAIEADSADGAREALDSEHTPELILLDWIMPGMNGLDLIGWLRTNSRYRTTPIVMVTANDGISQVAQALSAGANEYIIKPFTRESMEEKLSMLGLYDQE